MIDYPVDGSCPTYYQQLQAAGYHVMMAGKDHLTMSAGVGVNGTIHAKKLGFDDWERTVDKYEVFQYSYPFDEYTESLAEHGGSLYNATAACYGSFGMGTCCDQDIPGLEAGAFCPRTAPAGPDAILYPDDWTEASAELLFSRRPTNQSWFMQVGFPGPHPPFILTEEMNKSVAGRTYPAPQGASNTLGDEEFYQTMRRQYAAEIENIDKLIGKLLKKIEASGDLENTVVALSADHGEMLGDYNKYAKSMPWDGSARVPLIFKGPGIKRGVVSNHPVSSLDIVGTFLDYAGAEFAENMTTQSMRPLISSIKSEQGQGRSYVRSGLGSESFVGELHENEANDAGPPGQMNWRMVVKQMNASSTLKLICCPSGCDSFNGNSTLFPQAEAKSAQVGLFEISGTRVEVDLLSRGVGKSEAAQLVGLLPAVAKQACESLVSTAVQEIVV
jgi:arylsulfatase A-like enzyme